MSSCTQLTDALRNWAADPKSCNVTEDSLGGSGPGRARFHVIAKLVHACLASTEIQAHERAALALYFDCLRARRVVRLAQKPFYRQLLSHILSFCYGVDRELQDIQQKTVPLYTQCFPEGRERFLLDWLRDRTPSSKEQQCFLKSALALPNPSYIDLVNSRPETPERVKALEDLLKAVAAYRGDQPIEFIRCYAGNFQWNTLQAKWIAILSTWSKSETRSTEFVSHALRILPMLTESRFELKTSLIENGYNELASNANLGACIVEILASKEDRAVLEARALRIGYLLRKMDAKKPLPPWAFASLVKGNLEEQSWGAMDARFDELLLCTTALAAAFAHSREPEKLCPPLLDSLRRILYSPTDDNSWNDAVFSMDFVDVAVALKGDHSAVEAKDLEIELKKAFRVLQEALALPGPQCKTYFRCADAWIDGSEHPAVFFLEALHPFLFGELSEATPQQCEPFSRKFFSLQARSCLTCLNDKNFPAAWHDCREPALKRLFALEVKAAQKYSQQIQIWIRDHNREAFEASLAASEQTEN